MNVLATAPVVLPMTVDEPMARTSDIALVVTMSILALSMLAYTGYLAAADGRRFGTAGQFLAWAGTAALIVTIATRGLSVSRAPLGNMYEFALAAAGFAMLGFSLWSAVRDTRWLGLFVVGPVLLVLGAAATAWWTEASQLMPSLQSSWLVIHVTVATLSIGVFILGFALAVLFLLKRRREESGGSWGPAFLDRVPGADRLDKLTYSAHIIGFPLWTFTLVAGAIWAERAWGRYWGWDPKEVWTFVIWVVYAAYLHARATAGWTRHAVWLAIAGFVCIIINYAIVNVYFVGYHSYSGM
ncbi:c-type cytochrome biogenesis protein CcsB [Kytococcus sedentarius]|uniref:c-type cytochrome biogenesis protein CcsB n=1 Tax=Kytococcus sedentarius TaxID=1276 RepID=UPI0019500D08|nr:c-type cytochrome biogenesis protein CcsB [Kytococcus sedentarius]QRO87091.1 c-type cytochrome biogenesis protein CcsB [Kytococcus sedentarius]